MIAKCWTQCFTYVAWSLWIYKPVSNKSYIAVKSWRAQWRIKSPAYRSFTPVVQAQIKENIKALRHWPLLGELTGDRWIPYTKGQWRRNCFPFDGVSFSRPLIPRAIARRHSTSYERNLFNDHNGINNSRSVHIKSAPTKLYFARNVRICIHCKYFAK